MKEIPILDPNTVNEILGFEPTTKQNPGNKTRNSENNIQNPKNEMQNPKTET